MRKMKGALLVLMIGVAVTACGTDPAPTAGGDGMREYTSERFGVRMRIPAAWADPDPDRGAQPPSFFLLDALAADSLERGCDESAHHKLETFGKTPAIEDITVAGSRGCLILPSDDQHPDQLGQAQVIARYPSPIEVAGERYAYFVLDAHRNQIRDVVASIEFLRA